MEKTKIYPLTDIRLEEFKSWNDPHINELLEEIFNLRKEVKELKKNVVKESVSRKKKYE